MKIIRVRDFNFMKKIENNVYIAGVLVANNLEEKTRDDGSEYIGGSIVLRTDDESEHEIRFFADKYKKDANKNYTSEENKLYKSYAEFIETAKTIADVADSDERPTVVRITDGSFTANDYVPEGKTDVVTSNAIWARFINVVPEKDIDSTLMKAEFNVAGIIESIKDETKNDTPTGNKIITFNNIRQTSANGKWNKDAELEVDSLIPIKLTLPSDLVKGFAQIGYYEGCYTKFVGRLINTTKTEKVVEKMALGKDHVKEFTTYDRKYLIEAADEPKSIYDIDLTDEIVEALIKKRKIHLDDVKNNRKNGSSNNASEKPKTSANPFAKVNKNPFAK